MKKKDLTKDQINDILEMKRDGSSIKEIMDKYPFIKNRASIYYHLNKAPIEKKDTLKSIDTRLKNIEIKMDNLFQILTDRSIEASTKKEYQPAISKKPISPEPVQRQDNKPIAPGRKCLKTSEIRKLCFYADGKNPSLDVLQRAFKEAGLKSDDPLKKGYPVQEVLTVLHHRNNTTKKGSTIDLAELEKKVIG